MTPARTATKATYFASPAAFRRWLTTHHRSATELLVGFYKKATGRANMTWPESVDEALCVGWIDGVRRRVDDERYSIRFTPRRATSNWSAINVARVKVLTEAGRMRAAGLAAYDRLDKRKSGIYAYEQIKSAAFSADQVQQFRRSRAAWAFFASQPPSYRQRATYWVTSAKQAATRARRLDKLIETSGAQQRL